MGLRGVLRAYLEITSRPNTVVVTRDRAIVVVAIAVHCISSLRAGIVEQGGRQAARRREGRDLGLLVLGPVSARALHAVEELYLNGWPSYNARLPVPPLAPSLPCLR